MGLATANAVSSTTVRMVPSGPIYPLVAGPDSFEFQAKFLTLADLDAAAPNGTYQMVINGVHDGAHTISLTLNGNAYPSTNPHISNFTAAHWDHELFREDAACLESRLQAVRNG